MTEIVDHLQSEGTRWAERYLGIPFKKGGFDRNGTFCWGLVVMMYRDWVPHVELPRYVEVDPSNLTACANAFSDGKINQPWERIELGSERPLDIVLIDRYVKGALRPTHVGVIVAKGQYLAVEVDSDVMLYELQDLGPYFDSIWRHKELCG